MKKINQNSNYNTSVQNKVGKFWSNINTRLPRTRWWESTKIIQHVNKLVCGKPLVGWNEGAFQVWKKYLSPQQQYMTALSIGGGNGIKEMMLLEKKLVNHIYLFELSKKRIENGRQIAQNKGLQDNITFIYGDFFSHDLNKKDSFDVVFWDGSLHHMLDAFHAVSVSYNILKNGGIFFCNDFTGASRFQWSPKELMMANYVRKNLDECLFINPQGTSFSRYILRPDLQSIIDTDPSEAADSERILPSIHKIFPKAHIQPLGGVIYNLALKDILYNISEQSLLLQKLLKLDVFARDKGLSQYTFIISKKNHITQPPDL